MTTSSVVVGSLLIHAANLAALGTKESSSKNLLSISATSVGSLEIQHQAACGTSHALVCCVIPQTSLKMYKYDFHEVLLSETLRLFIDSIGGGRGEKAPITFRFTGTLQQGSHCCVSIKTSYERMPEHYVIRAGSCNAVHELTPDWKRPSNALSDQWGGNEMCFIQAEIKGSGSRGGMVRFSFRHLPRTWIAGSVKEAFTGAFFQISTDGLVPSPAKTTSSSGDSSPTQWGKAGKNSAFFKPMVVRHNNAMADMYKVSSVAAITDEKNIMTSANEVVGFTYVDSVHLLLQPPAGIEEGIELEAEYHLDPSREISSADRLKFSAVAAISLASMVLLLVAVLSPARWWWCYPLEAAAPPPPPPTAAATTRGREERSEKPGGLLFSNNKAKMR